MNPENNDGIHDGHEAIQSLHPVPDTGPLEIITEINGMAIRVTAQVDSKYSRNDTNQCEDAVGVAVRGAMIGICLADGVSQGSSNAATIRFARTISETVSLGLVKENETLPSMDDFQSYIKNILKMIIKAEQDSHEEQKTLAAAIIVAIVDTEKQVAYVLHLGDGFCGEVNKEGGINAFFGKRELLPRTETLDKWQKEGRQMDEIMEELAGLHSKGRLTRFVSAGKHANTWANEDLGNAVAVIPFDKGTSLIFGSDGILEEAIKLLSYSKDLAEYKADIPYEIYKATGPKRRRRDDTCMAAVYLGQ